MSFIASAFDKILSKVINNLIRIKNHNLFKPYELTIHSPIDHNSKERVNQYYSDPTYVKNYCEPTRLHFYKELIQFAKQKGIIFDNKQIADFGCGTGHLLSQIKQDFSTARLTGFDFSESAIEVAKKKFPEIPFAIFDIYEKQDKQYDIVFCTEVLEHLLHPEKALLNIIHSIKNEGFAILTVPNGRKDTYEGHINFWSPESWEQFLKKTANICQITTGLIEKGEVNYAFILKLPK